MAEYTPTNWVTGDKITAEKLNKIEAELLRLSGLVGATDDNIPAGMIAIWSGTLNDVPTGWVICDGDNGTPDLRDKFVLGAGENHDVGETGGSEEVTLTVEQLPSHTHTLFAHNSTSSTTSENNVLSGGSTDFTFLLGSKSWKPISANKNTGNSRPHPNMPPYYTLLYIMKT